MNLHTLRMIAALPRRRPESPAPSLPRLPRVAPAARHLVTTVAPLAAAAIRRLAQLLRPVA